MSFRSRWLTALFSCFVSLLMFRPVILHVIEIVILKFPAVILNYLSMYPFNSAGFNIMYYGALLLDANIFIIIISSCSIYILLIIKFIFLSLVTFSLALHLLV